MPGILNMLLSAGYNFVIDAQAATAFDSELSPTHALSKVQFQADGSVDMTDDSPTSFQMVTFGDLADIAIKVSGTGDTPAGDALNTWIAISDAPAFSLTTTGLGTLSFSGTYSVRQISTEGLLGGGTISLTSVEDL